MPNKKALDYINEVRSKISTLESALTEAHSLSEKDANKEIIETAMSCLENATNYLDHYKD